MSASEVPVASKVLKIFKRLVTYRPHLSDQTHRKLVQKKLREIYEVELLLEEISGIIESHPEITVARKPAPVKRKTDKDSFCTKSSPTEKKTDFQTARGENFATIAPRRPRSTAQDAKDALSCNCRDSNSIKVEDFAASTTPGPITEVEKSDSGEKKQQFKVYKLYRQRQISYGLLMKRAQVILNIRTSKHFVHELFSKHNKKEDLNGNLNTSVFERLYAQRKQRNTKKPEDIQKWELHMKKRREEKLKMERKRNQGLNANKFGNFSADTSVGINDENVNNEEKIFLISLSNSAISKSTMKSAKVDIDNTTKCSLQNVYRLLEELTLRFNTHLNLCRCKERDLLQ